MTCHGSRSKDISDEQQYFQDVWSLDMLLAEDLEFISFFRSS